MVNFVNHNTTDSICVLGKGMGGRAIWEVHGLAQSLAAANITIDDLSKATGIEVQVLLAIQRNNGNDWRRHSVVRKIENELLKYGVNIRNQKNARPFG